MKQGSQLKPIFFSKQADFRKWLEKNHDKDSEVLVGFFKVSSGKSGMTWSQSVDEALCFGWIDSVGKSVDEERYTIRFTPRKPKSNWSHINIRKVEELTRQGLMRPAGLAAFANREDKRSGIYSYENAPKTLDEKYEKKFKANKKAWAFFQAQPPYYQRVMTHRVMSAKQEATQLSRLEELIIASKEGRRL